MWQNMVNTKVDLDETLELMRWGVKVGGYERLNLLECYEGRYAAYLLYAKTTETVRRAVIISTRSSLLLKEYMPLENEDHLLEEIVTTYHRLEENVRKADDQKLYKVVGAVGGVLLGMVISPPPIFFEEIVLGGLGYLAGKHLTACEPKQKLEAYLKQENIMTGNCALAIIQKEREQAKR